MRLARRLEPEPIELLANARTKMASTCSTTNVFIAALALSALACVSMTLTFQPAALAASVAPPITSMFNASLARSATMPSVFALAFPPANKAQPIAAAAKSNLRIRSLHMNVRPLAEAALHSNSVSSPIKRPVRTA
jgi:hypothetical protein